MSNPDFPHTSRPDVAALEARIKELERQLGYTAALRRDADKEARRLTGKSETLRVKLLEAQERIRELEAQVASMQEGVDWLGDLENAGVDNWPGIDFAHELKREREAEGGAK